MQRFEPRRALPNRRAHPFQRRASGVSRLRVQVGPSEKNGRSWSGFEHRSTSGAGFQPWSLGWSGPHPSVGRGRALFVFQERLHDDSGCPQFSNCARDPEKLALALTDPIGRIIVGVRMGRCLATAVEQPQPCVSWKRPRISQMRNARRSRARLLGTAVSGSSFPSISSEI